MVIANFTHHFRIVYIVKRIYSIGSSKKERNLLIGRKHELIIIV